MGGGVLGESVDQALLLVKVNVRPMVGTDANEPGGPRGRKFFVVHLGRWGAQFQRGTIKNRLKRNHMARRVVRDFDACRTHGGRCFSRPSPPRRASPGERIAGQTHPTYKCRRKERRRQRLPRGASSSRASSERCQSVCTKESDLLVIDLCDSCVSSVRNL